MVLGSLNKSSMPTCNWKRIPSRNGSWMFQFWTFTPSSGYSDRAWESCRGTSRTMRSRKVYLHVSYDDRYQAHEIYDEFIPTGGQDIWVEVEHQGHEGKRWPRRRLSSRRLSIKTMPMLMMMMTTTVGGRSAKETFYQ